MVVSPKPPRPRSPPGFRFSAADGVVLAVAAGLTVALWRTWGDLAPLLPVVVGHFFLFCNVFRVRRAYEVAWAAAFVANLSAWTAAGRFGWGNVLLAQCPVTLAVIAAEVLSVRYHGIGYQLRTRATAGEDLR
ncbi:MAG TPA: hypothetical protein VF796_14025 [Humisphaera sp.]